MPSQPSHTHTKKKKSQAAANHYNGKWDQARFIIYLCHTEIDPVPTALQSISQPFFRHALSLSFSISVDKINCGSTCATNRPHT